MGVKRAALVASWLAVLTLGTGSAEALGLRSSQAELFLGDAKPGETLSSARAPLGPLTAENAGKEPLSLGVSARGAPRSRLRDGFEPLPDLKWVVIPRPSHSLDPGETAEIGLEARVPDDPRLANGQYQFDAVLAGRTAAGAALELRTAVLLTVGGADPPPAPKEPDDGVFALTPAKARLEGFPLGARKPDRPYRAAVRIANAGTEELRVTLSPVRSWDESVRFEEGWTPAPNPRWLKAPAPIRVKPGKVAEAAFELEIPDQPRYRGRRMAFVVAVDARRGGLVTRRWWTLYVKTE